MAEAWEPYFSYHVEHITATQHAGSDAETNLAFACNHCNLIKGPNLTSIDPDTGKVTPLFNPRTESWDEHFRRDGERILGLTPAGRTTVFLLQMNAPHRAELRVENADAW
jgi:hypothetical protein